MLAIERHREILSLLGKEGSVRVAELARRFQVTEETIRRDFGKLESQGKIVRSHGGAIITEHEETLRPFAWREVDNEAEKAAIAREAVKRINPDDRIMLDASTTAWHLAKHLEDLPLTVITNSLQIAIALAHRPQINIHLLGGRMGKKSLSFTGPAAEQQLRQYHADKLFMSCEGIDLLRGISDISENQAHLRRIMLSCADRRYLLADHSKFSVRSLSRICGVEDFNEIITDAGTRPEIITELNTMDIKTAIAGSPNRPTSI
jgi:DeoR/GlpR family transcriptional regulator of sugar metabolism